MRESIASSSSFWTPFAQRTVFFYLLTKIGDIWGATYVMLAAKTTFPVHMKENAEFSFRITVEQAEQVSADYSDVFCQFKLGSWWSVLSKLINMFWSKVIAAMVCNVYNGPKNYATHYLINSFSYSFSFYSMHADVWGNNGTEKQDKHGFFLC